MRVNMLVYVAVGLILLDLRDGYPTASYRDLYAQPRVERVDFRRCWWRKGERHCRWVIRKPAKRSRYGGSAPELNLPPNLGWW